jgi:hypothetical protein
VLVPRSFSILAVILICCPKVVCGVDTAARQFDETVAPILIQHCLECHSGTDPKGQLDLSSLKTTLAGGESGEAIVVGEPQMSLLWERVDGDEMPPKKPLADSDKMILQRWIQSGAKWGTDPLDSFRFTTSKRAGYDWWALQPVGDHPLPVVQNDSWVRNGIDHFILEKLESSKLNPSSPADRRTLIRRLSFDLLGLPPTSDAVTAFENDRRPDAYERLVDQMLASPHYGARWARHWLDVARFGESQGFERDKIRENSWPYRDWVINALNADLPYDEFSKRQIAGDVLYPNNSHAIIATGFLVAGPYDEVGQSQQSAAMKAVVRQDELEDIVSVVSQTFLSLTVNCARCHDHKFDPIRQREYYQMTASLDGVRHGSRDVQLMLDDGLAERLEAEIDDLRIELGELDKRVRLRINAAAVGDALPDAPLPRASWLFDTGLDDSVGQLHGSGEGNTKITNGSLVVDGKGSFVATTLLVDDLREKTLEAWVKLDDLDQRGGAVMSVVSLDGGLFDAIVFGEREPGRWMAGSDTFQRTQDVGGAVEADAKDRAVHVAIAYHSDGTIALYRDGKPYGTPYKSSGPLTFSAGKAKVVFGLRHFPPGGNRMLSGAIEAAHLYDRALTPIEIERSAAVKEAFIEAFNEAITPAEQKRRVAIQAEISKLATAIPRSKNLSTYAVKPRNPGVAHVLLRGNPATVGEPVAANGIESLVGLEADFGLLAEASDADRRRRLAEWITEPTNPLFARVIGNRLWHHHFGVGLVETPNDFGFNGGRPSHQELIDFLARELIHRNWSVKSLHRLIVTSATYRQSSRYVPASAAVDADNRLLWRKSPQRLEAESLRDTVLSVSGELNQQMGGPGYRDFETFTKNTQFYTMTDPVGPEFNRRSVYRTWLRSGRNRMLDVFDCPDPSTKTPKRAVTVTPLQALTLMNNSFVLRMSDRFADRLQSEVGDDVHDLVRRAYQLAYNRNPDEEESNDAVSFVAAHTLSDFCRVIINSNEFLHVD